MIKHRCYHKRERLSCTDEGILKMITAGDNAVVVYRYKAELINTNFLKEHFRLIMRAFMCDIL